VRASASVVKKELATSNDDNTPLIRPNSGTSSDVMNSPSPPLSHNFDENNNENNENNDNDNDDDTDDDNSSQSYSSGELVQPQTVPMPRKHSSVAGFIQQLTPAQYQEVKQVIVFLC
jgi:hypothetical protein